MEPTRREILRGASLLPLVFGFAALGCKHDPFSAESNGRVARGKPWSPKDGPPDWWNEALAWTRRGERPGVALRIPQDAVVARTLGTTLVDLCARGNLDQRLLFTEAVFVCLTDAQIAAFLKGARPEDDAILFDAREDRVDGIAIPAADAGDRARLGATLRALVEGARGERLATVAAERRAAATKEQLAALDPLPVDHEGGLTWAFPEALLPALLSERRTTSDAARRAKIEAALRQNLDAGVPHGLHAAQPYGVEMSSSGRGCGEAERAVGILVDCGMAMPTPSSYRFLGYLTTPG